ncbi:MAG: phage tail protein [Saccharospirillaceae bacterium]|nr:phage tail protein [Saccharospirillaceae bacterium]
MSLLKTGFNQLIEDGNEQPKSDASLPLETNAIPVIYGRPGWQTALPVKIGYRNRAAAESLNVVYVVSEGVQRIPDAITMSGYLDAYSDKYKNGDIAKNLASISEKATGDSEDGYGFKLAKSGKYYHGFPAGWRFSKDDEYYSEGQALALLRLEFNIRDSHKYTSGNLPEVQYLPNGQMLHDPRIEWNSDRNYLIPTDDGRGPGNTLAGWPDYINHSISHQVPRSHLGGVLKGWSSENHQFYKEISADRVGAGFRVCGYGYDGTPDETELGDTPDNNPALVIIDYLTADYGAGIPVSDINLPSIIDGANYCDALAPTFAGGPQQPQMSCDIAIDTGNSIRDNLSELLKTCRGRLAWIDGQYHLNIRKAATAPAFAITKDQIKERKSLEYGVKDKRYNRAIGTYVEPRNQYKQRQVIYPPAEAQQFKDWVESDGGVNEKEINLVGCADIYRAADLLSSIVKESRAGIKATYVCTLELLAVTVGDVVTVTDDKFDQMRFWVESAEIDLKNGLVLLGLLEHVDSAYDHLTHGHELPAAGTELLPDSRVVSSVTGLTFSAGSFNTNKSGVLSWTAPEDARITGYLVEVVKSGSSEPVFSAPVNGTAIQIPYLTPADYIARVVSVTDVTRSRPASVSFSHDVPELPAVTGLTLLAPFSGRSAELQWNDIALDAFDKYRVRVLDPENRAEIYRATASQPRFEYGYETNLKVGLRRRFVVEVAAISISEALSQPAEITVENLKPVAPTLSVTAEVNSVSAVWVNNQAPDIVGTRLGWKKSGGSWAYVDMERSATQYQFENLDSDADYDFRILSRDAFGSGEWSGVRTVSTKSPLKPSSFRVTPGVNEASLVLTAPVGYQGITIWYGNDANAAGDPIYSGSDTSIKLPGLQSGASYRIYYKAFDAKRRLGELVGPLSFTTQRLLPSDVSGLSPWATKTDPIDKSWISDKLAGDAIPSEKIENLIAAKLTSGLITATIGIQSGGSIETINNGFKTGIGVYEADGVIYTFISADSSGNIKTGITADGVLKATGAEIAGKVTIGAGSTGYAAILDKPATLADINAQEAEGLKTQTAVILINQEIKNGALHGNNGEAVICATNTAGTPDITRDGTIQLGGQALAIPRSPAVGVQWTINTNRAARGWIVWNRSSTEFLGYQGKPANVVFAVFSDQGWKYDNNTDWIEFEPNEEMWIIGEMTCSQGDKIQSAEIYREAKPIARVSEIGATRNTGALADRDDVDWSNDVKGSNKPADNATRNTGALADKDTVDWADDVKEKPQFTGFYDAFNGDIGRWQNYQGSGEFSVQSGDGAGGKILTIGNNDGDDQRRLIHQEIIPFNPESLYRVRCRIRRTAGDAKCFIGLAGVNENGGFVNTHGLPEFNVQHYFAAANREPNDWEVFTGYLKGYAPVGEKAITHNRDEISAPGTLHADCVGIRPFILVNASGKSGTYEVDYFSVDVIPDDMLWSSIGGDNKPADNATRNTGALADKDSLTADEVGADPAGAADTARLASFKDDFDRYDGDVVPDGVIHRIPIRNNTSSVKQWHKIAEWKTTTVHGALSIAGSIRSGKSGRYQYQYHFNISLVANNPITSVSRNFTTQGSTGDRSLRVYYEVVNDELTVNIYSFIPAAWNGLYISADVYYRSGVLKLWQREQPLGQEFTPSGNLVDVIENRGVTDNADVTDYQQIDDNIAAAAIQVSNALSKTNWTYSGSWHIDSKADAFEFVFSQIPQLYKPYLRLAILQNDLESNIDISLNDHKFTAANGPDAKTEWLVFDVPDDHIKTTSDNVIKIGHNGTGPDDWGYIYQVKLLVDQKKMALDGVSWSDIDSRPGSLAELDSTASDKLSGIADNATRNTGALADKDSLTADEVGADPAGSAEAARIAGLSDDLDRFDGTQVPTYTLNRIPFRVNTTSISQWYKMAEWRSSGPNQALSITGSARFGGSTRYQYQCHFNLSVITGGAANSVAAARFETQGNTGLYLRAYYEETATETIVTLYGVITGMWRGVYLSAEVQARGGRLLAWQRENPLGQSYAAAGTQIVRRENRGVVDNADPTKTVIDGGLVTTGGVQLDGDNAFIKAAKANADDLTAGVWLGLVGGKPEVHIGDAISSLRYTTQTGLAVKGRVEITGGSGYAALEDSPNNLQDLDSSASTKLGGIAANATRNTGALADRNDVDWTTHVKGNNRPADNATRNTGALADRNDVDWTTHVKGNNRPADNATRNTGALADRNDVDWTTHVKGNNRPADNATRNTGALANQNTVVWGNQIAGRPADEDLLNYRSQGGVTRIAAPGGATFSINSFQVGAIKIQLPQGFTNTMLKFVVDVFNYRSGESFSVEIAGYNYGAGGGVWVHCSSKVSGTKSVPVRFGHEGGKCCVWLGNTDTTWRYPKVMVRDFVAGHTNYGAANWKSGWVLSLVTSLGTSQIHHTANLGGADWDNVSGANRPADNATRNTGALADRDDVDWNTHVTGANRPASNADVTKTVIDGGLVTTGGLHLQGGNAYLRAGKLSQADTSSGIWLGMVASVPKMNIGNATEYLQFDGVNLKLKTPDLDLIAGVATFKGNLNAANDSFRVARQSHSTITTPNGTSRAIAVIETSLDNTAGIIAYSREQYGGYFESYNGDGVRGISMNNDGGKFTSSDVRRTGVTAENKDGGVGLLVESNGAYKPQVVINPAQLSSRLPPVVPGGLTCDHKHWYGAVKGNNGVWKWRRFTTGSSSTFHDGGSSRRTSD